MEMASSAGNGTGNTTTRSSIVGGINTLPSLFAHEHHGGSNSRSSPLVSGKDIDGLIAMNDSALSQQIEFILQEAPMEHEDDDHDMDDDDDDDDATTMQTTTTTTTRKHANNSNATIKLQQHNPPNNSIIVTSASDYPRAAMPVATIATTQQQTMTHHQQQQHHHLLNGRRIIIQTTQQQQQPTNLVKEEEADPELNDENLQDIEEEAQAAEAEVNQQQHLQIHSADVKMEHIDTDNQQEFIRTSGINYISTPTITTHHTAQLTGGVGGQTQQIVLPAGSIVGTTTSGRTITVPVSEALAQLAQRRPVYISNAMGNMTGATFVRMPAVINRSPMTVLNLVQQGVGGNGPTQLILQATPVSQTGTPMTVVTTTTPTLAAANNVGNADIATHTQTSAPIMPALTAVTTQQQQQQTSSPTRTLSSTPVASTVVTQNTAATSVAKSSASHSVASSSTSTSHGSGNASINNTTNNNPQATYQCHECVEEFESKELFDIHRSGHANNMKCAICNMVLKSLKNYEKHCLRCKPYECQICGRVVRFRPNFIKHMRVHTGQQSERHKYKCDVCHKEFMSFEYFKVHKKIHNENVNLTCEICGKVFSALASLRGHSKLHSGVKLHKCDVCGKGFGQRYNLKIHARTHTGDFPFECKVCKKKLHTQSSLQTHMQVHQRDQNSQATTTTKYEKIAPATTSSSSSSTAATIVKLEPQQQDDGPSTSGMQRHLQKQLLEDMDDENSGMSDSLQGIGNGGGINANNSSRIVSTASLTNAINNTIEDSSNESSNASHELQQQLQQQQQQSLLVTPTRTIVIKNYMQNDQNAVAAGGSLTQTQSQHQTHVIQSSSGNNTLQQQLLRKTPIIHSTGGAGTLSTALASVVQQTGTSPSPSPSSSSTSCSSSVVVSKSGAPLSLASAAIGTSTIRSTRNHQTQFNSSSSSSTSLHRVLQRNNNNNHRNHHNNHRRRHPTHLDDDDDDDLEDYVDSAHRHAMRVNGQHHFDDDDDDEKSSPSLATTAMIKVEPNLYSSGSGDNSNEMLIKEEVMFEDSAAPHSPHSPPSSKFRISNFDSELVDHHVDLNNSLPPYGNLFDPHSIPDTIPVQLYPDDDDDFRLDHSSLGPLHQTSSSTNDGDYIKKEWVYGAGSSYTMNGKFGDDSDALCDSANFIYD